MYTAKENTKSTSVVGFKKPAGAFFQPKLTMNEPGDVYEHEADAMADKVMRMTEVPANQDAFFKPAWSKPVSNVAQRKCQACEEEEQHIHRKETAAPTPAPAAACPVTCNLPIVLYSNTKNCGSGDDFKNHDMPGGPRGTLAAAAVWTYYSRLTDPELLDNMLHGMDGLESLAGAPGRAAAMNFYNSGLKEMNHDISTPIGAAANAAPSFISTATSVERAFQTIMTGMAAAPASNTCGAYSLNRSAVPRVDFPLPDPFDPRVLQNLLLKAVIGGTHGIEITLTALKIDCTAHTYSATVHYRICDNFGVDDQSDLYAPSLISFWVLQHMRSGHMAFVNNILLDRTFSGGF